MIQPVICRKTTEIVVDKLEHSANDSSSLAELDNDCKLESQQTLPVAQTNQIEKQSTTMTRQSTAFTRPSSALSNEVRHELEEQLGHIEPEC